MVYWHLLSPDRATSPSPFATYGRKVHEKLSFVVPKTFVCVVLPSRIAISVVVRRRDYHNGDVISHNGDLITRALGRMGNNCRTGDGQMEPAARFAYPGIALDTFQ